MIIILWAIACSVNAPHYCEKTKLATYYDLVYAKSDCQQSVEFLAKYPEPTQTKVWCEPQRKTNVKSNSN